MRMSCNGCRVLRKGCSDDCTIRPCLQWIKSPDSQANATLFLAKFYGRAGLINLIEAGPPHLRPALFRSLLYEACGRIVNPVYGSVGMLWAGNWAQCQAAVDAVLKGSPIMQIPPPVPPPPPPPPPHFDPAAGTHPISPLQTCDIRHVSKDPNAVDLNRFKNMNRLKQPISRPTTSQGGEATGRMNPGGFRIGPGETWLSQLRKFDSYKDDESMFSVETVEGSLANRVESWKTNGLDEDEDKLGLDLSLGLVPM